MVCGSWHQWARQREATAAAQGEAHRLSLANTTLEQQLVECKAMVGESAAAATAARQSEHQARAELAARETALGAAEGRAEAAGQEAMHQGKALRASPSPPPLALPSWPSLFRPLRPRGKMCSPSPSDTSHAPP